ncbi:hypothetical protein WMW72_12290 [Paenibacillus filicis]|uniref:Uncharacterized protein n=1 Tax=Paenibacillus filicis TaxID=669464 RepID=A0ABU9DKR6_9BACL
MELFDIRIGYTYYFRTVSGGSFTRTVTGFNGTMLVYRKDDAEEMSEMPVTDFIQQYKQLGLRSEGQADLFDYVAEG